MHASGQLERRRSGYVEAGRAQNSLASATLESRHRLLSSRSEASDLDLMFASVGERRRKVSLLIEDHSSTSNWKGGERSILKRSQPMILASQRRDNIEAKLT